MRAMGIAPETGGRAPAHLKQPGGGEQPASPLSPAASSPQARARFPGTQEARGELKGVLPLRPFLGASKATRWCGGAGTQSLGFWSPCVLSRILEPASLGEAEMPCLAHEQTSYPGAFLRGWTWQHPDIFKEGRPGEDAGGTGGSALFPRPHRLYPSKAPRASRPSYFTGITGWKWPPA